MLHLFVSFARSAIWRVWYSPSKIFNKGEALQICSYTHRTPPMYPIDGAKSIGEYSELNEIITQTFIREDKLKEWS